MEKCLKIPDGDWPGRSVSNEEKRWKKDKRNEVRAHWKGFAFSESENGGDFI
jgi:hypothetical protein